MLDTRGFVLLAYDAFGGSIKGKMKVQKQVYFLGVMVGIELGYGPHYYGPYSAAVAESNSELLSLGYLEESLVGGGVVDNWGFEIARHDFNLTEEGAEAAELKKEHEKELASKIENAAKSLAHAADLSYVELSIAAKAYFLLRKKDGPASNDELVDLAGKFNWSVSPEQIATAVEFLCQVRKSVDKGFAV